MISKFFKKILVLTNYLAAFALLLSIIAPFVSPEHVKILSIFGLAFPYLIITNIIFLSFWILFKSPNLMISLTLILFIGGRYVYNRSIQNPTKVESNKQDKLFSVMSFNVRVFDLYNWTNNKQSRDKIFSFIRKEAPEVLCIQEYFNSTNSKYFTVHDSLMANQSFKYSHIHYTDQLKDNNFGIATYSNYKIINKQAYPFKKTNNLFITSDIIIGLDTVRVINCHLESIRLNEKDYNIIDSIKIVSEKQHLKEVEGIVARFQDAFVKRSHQANYINYIISESPYPTICSGDFNDTQNSYAYNTIKENLYDSFITTGAINGGTYNRFFPSFRIDFLLYSNQIQCNDFETYNVDLSDHKPIKGLYKIVSR